MEISEAVPPPFVERLCDRLENLQLALSTDEIEWAEEIVTDALRDLRRLRQDWVLVPLATAEQLARADEIVHEATTKANRAEQRLAHLTRRIRPDVRKAVYDRDHGRCRYCGVELGRGNAQMDHYEPNGPETLTNLVTSCRNCNQRKGAISPRQLKRRRGMKLLGDGVMKPPSIKASDRQAVLTATAIEAVVEIVERKQEEERQFIASPLCQRFMTEEEIESEIMGGPALLFRPDEVAEFFGVTPEKVIASIKSGELHAMWFGKKSPRIGRQEVLRIVRG